MGRREEGKLEGRKKAPENMTCVVEFNGPFDVAAVAFSIVGGHFFFPPMEELEVGSKLGLNSQIVLLIKNESSRGC